MRALILSDIHGNLEALEAVLTAANGLWDEVWNLGDTVGYGGNPNQVVERMRALATVNVRGNHDRACCGLLSPDAFNPVARAAALWTRSELTEDNLAWLRNMPQGPVTAAPGLASCAHGSPLHEDEYLMNMRDAWTPLEQMQTPVTFFGHTHVQGGFARNGALPHPIEPAFPEHPDGNRRRSLWSHGSKRSAATEQSQALRLNPGERLLINPGSVGQPRDQDWRAAFAVYDSEAATVRFHRVSYDVASAQRRILAAGLPEKLADRLRAGR